MQTCKEFLKGAYYEFEVCWVAAGSSSSGSLFGVSDYLSALALLLVIYTISDYRNKLRLSLAPIPVYHLSFWLFVAVFVLKLLAEVWFYNGWPLLPVMDDRLLIDSFLLAPCVLAILYWVFVSYIRPPKFSRWNSRRFFWFYQRAIHHDGDTELRIALHELARSAHSLIKFAPCPPNKRGAPWNLSRSEQVAHDFLLLLANRRVCAEMACFAPNTAEAIFNEVSAQDKAEIPFHTFAQNVSVEFLNRKTSPIFHEDSGWDSGWSGYVQLYSSAIFTNPKLIRSLSNRHSSPLDPRYNIRDKWDAENWKAYTRVSLLYIERLLEESRHGLDGGDSFAVNQVLDNCKSMVHDLYNLNDDDSRYYQRDEYNRLSVLVDFLRALMKLLDDKDVKIWSSLKPEDTFNNGFHERIADLIFDLIFKASQVRKPVETCWGVTHNTVWSRLFNFNDNKTSKWIYRRVARLIYQEMREMDKFYNFKGASYLGFCLNVLGLNDQRHKNYGKQENPLRLAVLDWTRRHYERMRVKSPKVANACLHGSITYDADTREFIKTYSNETGSSPDERRFKVNPYSED
ncbi:hypothetical protein [Roseovarius sp. 2305UL8-3]|uniref:hypothetical protein n=1 Tax=Roseovarius conchicola TaxID=3121636 RepID=UPI00352813E9